MSDWRPDLYLQFERERTRPCRELAAQIPSGTVGSIIDLGCGPGNSTAVLAERWPAAAITGLDSSMEMLSRARQSCPQHHWMEGDIREWAEGVGGSFDLVFSNAALQWVEDHAALFPKLLRRVAPGGFLAVQMPNNREDAAHRIMQELAVSADWRTRFPGNGVRRWFVHQPDFYYDLLAPEAAALAIWETTYIHVLPGIRSIAEWYRATGMRPYLDRLEAPADQERFIEDYTQALRSAYKSSKDGNVLFPFRRLFLIAAKAATA